MSDELRDRIVEAITNRLTYRMRYVDGPVDGSEVLQVDGFVDPREIAQAVIDDLGLTAERGATHGDGWVHKLEDQDEAEQMVRWNPGMRQVSRVIGRWVPVE